MICVNLCHPRNLRNFPDFFINPFNLSHLCSNFSF